LVETPAAKSNGADKGLIGAQSPIPGEKVARETGIAYSISLGPDLVKLPYLVGNRIDTVQSRLQEAGFVVGSVTGNQQRQAQASPHCWKISEKQCNGATWRNS
jgi:beta-lactam-binding protein with PASTA domain